MYVDSRVVATGLGCEGLKILVEALKENHTVTDLRWTMRETIYHFQLKIHICCTWLSVYIIILSLEWPSIKLEMLELVILQNCWGRIAHWRISGKRDLSPSFQSPESFIYLKSSELKCSASYRLRDNLVTDKGADVLMAALKENTTLEHLW